MIVEVSVILSAFFPDEAQAQAQALLADHVAGRVTLQAPALLPYELCNAVWQAERRQRITPEQTGQILQAMAGLDIAILPQMWGEMLPLARQFGRSAYDAAYLSLAQTLEEELITADQRLFHAVQGSLDWVLWIGDYGKQKSV